MRKKRFFIYILLLVMMLMAAVFFPWLVFSVQDSFRLRSTQVQTREDVELEQLNIPYEMSVSERLGNFAGKPEGYFVTATDYAYSMEHYVMLEELLYGEFVVNLVGYELPNSIWGAYDISELKKYVIYNEELDNGVAFIAWYAALSLSSGDSVEFLWDAKTATVYCVKYERNAGEMKWIETDEEPNEAWAGPENSISGIYQENIEQVEIAQLADSWLNEWDYFLVDYYGSDFWLFLNMISEAEQRDDRRYEVSQSNTSGGNQETWELILNDREKKERTSMISGRHWSNGLTDIFHNEIAFPYGENFLKFVTREEITENGDSMDIELLFGIKELGALIPEFEELAE